MRARQAQNQGQNRIQDGQLRQYRKYRENCRRTLRYAQAEGIFQDRNTTGRALIEAAIQANDPEGWIRLERRHPEGQWSRGLWISQGRNLLGLHWDAARILLEFSPREIGRKAPDAGAVLRAITQAHQEAEDQDEEAGGERPFQRIQEQELKALLHPREEPAEEC